MRVGPVLVGGGEGGCNGGGAAASPWEEEAATSSAACDGHSVSFFATVACRRRPLRCRVPRAANSAHPVRSRSGASLRDVLERP